MTTALERLTRIRRGESPERVYRHPSRFAKDYAKDSYAERCMESDLWAVADDAIEEATKDARAAGQV